MKGMLGAAHSFLFVPADRAERYSKAVASGTDMIILDLEDAVAENAKADARRAVVAALADGFGGAALIRINAASASSQDADFAALRGIDGVSAIMVPKVESARDVAAVRAVFGPKVAICALVETVRGLFGMRAMLAAGGVDRVAFGSVDFRLDAGIEGDGVELDAVRSEIVLECAFAGLPPPIDGITVEIGDDAIVHQAADRARRFGFGGKLCIHPRQVAAVNDAFAPDASRIDWAERVIAATGEAGAIAIDGKMVDRPVIEQARAILGAARLHRTGKPI